MFEFIKGLFGKGSKTDFARMVKEGAQIIDVRTPEEFSIGHIKGSVNIPLDKMLEQLSRIKKDKPIITCCASGIRSGSAKAFLLRKGYTEVYNGGGWYGLQQIIG